MILGFVRIENGAVVTHRDTYLLSPLSVFSVRRPFALPAFVLAGAFAGFTAAFGDLLYQDEIHAILAACGAALVTGSQVGQLRLHGGNLRGSQLGNLVWGRYGSLNKKRRELTAEIHALGQVEKDPTP